MIRYFDAEYELRFALVVSDLEYNPYEIVRRKDVESGPDELLCAKKGRLYCAGIKLIDRNIIIWFPRLHSETWYGALSLARRLYRDLEGAFADVEPNYP